MAAAAAPLLPSRSDADKYRRCFIVVCVAHLAASQNSRLNARCLASATALGDRSGLAHPDQVVDLVDGVTGSTHHEITTSTSLYAR